MEPIVGAAGAAGKAIAKAVEGDEKVSEALVRIAAASGDFDKAAVIKARRVLMRQQIMLKCWQPLRHLVGAPRDYFDGPFKEEMLKRLEDVPIEELTAPKGSIAGPSIQGIGFAIDEPSLRDMYLNLLATAADKRVADVAHPSFAEVIRQLTSEEARALASVLETELHPIVEIRVKTLPEEGGYRTAATNVLPWGRYGSDGETIYLTAHHREFHLSGRYWQPPGNPGFHQVAAPERAMFVDNWVRLGLVSVEYLAGLAENENYEWVENAPILADARLSHQTVKVARGSLTVTAFGKAFHRAVITPSPAADDR